MSLDELYSIKEELPSLSIDGIAPRRGRRPTIGEAIDDAAGAIESLPASVRLEALARIQLRILTGVTDEQSKRRGLD